MYFIRHQLRISSNYYISLELDVYAQNQPQTKVASYYIYGRKSDVSRGSIGYLDYSNSSSNVNVSIILTQTRLSVLTITDVYDRDCPSRSIKTESTFLLTEESSTAVNDILMSIHLMKGDEDDMDGDDEGDDEGDDGDDEEIEP